jgi:hypothetical protein
VWAPSARDANHSVLINLKGDICFRVPWGIHDGHPAAGLKHLCDLIKSRLHGLLLQCSPLCLSLLFLRCFIGCGLVRSIISFLPLGDRGFKAFQTRSR